MSICIYDWIVDTRRWNHGSSGLCVSHVEENKGKDVRKGIKDGQFLE